MQPDPMEGIAAVDAPLGEIIFTPNEPNQEAIDGLQGQQIPFVQTEATTGNPPAADLGQQAGAPAADADAGGIKIGGKVIVVADGREGLVTWKGPNDKIKLAFEDGSTATLDKADVLASA